MKQEDHTRLQRTGKIPEDFINKVKSSWEDTHNMLRNIDTPTKKNLTNSEKINQATPDPASMDKH